MKNMKKLIITFILSLVSVLALGVGITYTWFDQGDKKEANTLNGSILQNYFHCGDGSQTFVYDTNGKVINGPFVITRPKHYENLVWLHRNVKGFSESGFYFEIGFDLDDTGEKKVYNYTDEGRIDVNQRYSKVLNLKYLDPLIPLGSNQYPFVSHINGNDNTIKNFTVIAKDEKTAHAYADVGIFGYVGEGGTCNNIYFSDFTIDPDQANYPEVESDITHEGHEDNNIYVGYIAGHIKNANDFENVYINNCKIDSKIRNQRIINNFGYYGRVDFDNLGGQIGVGNDYQFHFNADAMYSYFSSTYETIKNNNLYIRDRNTFYDLKTGEQKKDVNGNPLTENGKLVGVSEYPSKTISDAVTKEGNNQYILNGNLPTNSSAYEESYSTSTLGYGGYEINYQNFYYDTKYHYNGNEYNIPENVRVINSIEAAKNDLNNLDANGNLVGDFYYYQNEDNLEEGIEKGWRYTHADVRNSTVDDKVNTKVRIDGFTINGGLLTSGYSGYETYLTIDDRRIDIRNNVTITRSGDVFTIKFSEIDVGLLSVGEHNFSFAFHISVTHWLLGTTHPGRYIGNDGGVITNADNTTSKILNQIPFVLTNRNLDNNGYKIISRSVDENLNAYNDNINNRYDLNQLGTTPFVFEQSLFYENTHIDAPLFFAPIEKNEDGSYTNVNGPYTQKVSIDYKDVILDTTTIFSFINGRMIAHFITLAEDRGTVDNPKQPTTQWISDAQIIKDSGYSPYNFDIVGGGVNFRNVGFGIGNVVSVPSESTSQYAVKKIKPSDINQPFNAAKYCPSSIVLYIKNTSNALDTRDDILGSISYSYYTIESIGIGWLTNLFNIGKPSFKKGNAINVELDGYRNVTSTTSGLTKQLTLSEMKESDAKIMSYCTLDKNGNILGSFDINGNSDVETGLTNENILKIDTYVIAIGCKSTGNSSTNTWIDAIDFSYKAELGYGGTFGSVGYRNAIDKIENTILNFYFDFNSTSSAFSVSVIYDPTLDANNKASYHIKFISNETVSINIFLYDAINYSLWLSTSLNGTEIELTGNRHNNVTIPASG